MLKVMIKYISVKIVFLIYLLFPGLGVNAKNANECKISVECVDFYVRTTLERSSYINSTHSTPILHIFCWFTVDLT